MEVVGDARWTDGLGRTVRMRDSRSAGHLVIESGHQTVPSVLGAKPPGESKAAR
jgi:hypothetical protein